jgi:hypothetical protein
MKTFEEIVEEYDKVGQDPSVIEFFKKCAVDYSEQIIDAANDIIDPAAEVLSEGYDEDYDNWYKLLDFLDNN